MCKSVTAVLIGVSVLIQATGALAQDSGDQNARGWLNAAAWDLTFDVSFKSTSEGSAKSLFGPVTFTRTLDREFSASIKLDSRSAGPSLSMTRLTSGAGAADPSSPEYQQAIMSLVTRSESMATWMNSGPPIDENASDEAQRAAALAFMRSLRGTAHLDYQTVVKGMDLVDEMGSHFNQTTTTTGVGSGPVSPSGQFMFELDAEAKRYMLSLTFAFRDDSMSTVKTVIVVHQDRKGEPPTDTRTEQQSGLDLFPAGLAIDDSTALLGDIPIMEGGIEVSAGKIMGTRTVKGHYVEGGENVPGTFVFHYTLTPR